MRKYWAGAALAAAMAVASGSAQAKLEPGEMAPVLEGKEFVNTPPLSLKQLRGHVILYEVFRTW
jgi:hypothetical protein